MSVAYAILILGGLLFVLTVLWAAIALGIGRIAGAIANRLGHPKLTAGVRWITTAVTLIGVALGVIVAFGAVANARAASKATMLARGISELASCTPFFVPAVALIVGGAIWFVWRLSRSRVNRSSRRR